MFARVLPEDWLSRLLNAGVNVEIEGRIEVGDGTAVDVKELVVEECGEVFFGGHGLVKKSLRWRELVQVRNVLGHVGTPMALVCRHGRQRRV
jgi:hypothetical protein